MYVIVYCNEFEEKRIPVSIELYNLVSKIIELRYKIIETLWINSV